MPRKVDRRQAVAAVAAGIEDYLRVNRDAADSPEGIHGFWLPVGLRSEPLECVLEALDELEGRGVVTKTEIDGVGPVYSSSARLYSR